MRQVDPVSARKGVYIDEFRQYDDVKRVGERLERILKYEKAKGEIVFTVITSAKSPRGTGAPKFSYQLFWIKEEV